MKKFLNFIFSRVVIVGVLILIQIAVIITVIIELSDYFMYFYGICILLSILVVMHLMSKNENPSYKLAWAIPILLFPLFGGLFYLIAGKNSAGKKFSKKLQEAVDKTIPYMPQDEKIIDELAAQDKSIANQARYIKDHSTFPIYKNSTTKYLSPGESFYQILLQELEKAEHFIFMEYFIIREGKMWNTILEILEQKVKEGVDVRVMYDDVGCVSTLPYKYHEELCRRGIKCSVFNPLSASLNIIMNNRDHRKITVIDGSVGFLGGINLADEYINVIERFGHWKDAAIMVKGEAVWNLTIMFLQTWNFTRNEWEDYEKFRPHQYHQGAFESDGFVLPYGDSPLDQETVGENVYLNLLYKAKDYVYICTPYLVVDNEMITALCLAAKGGVDVRIITPHIEDKWYVHILTRSCYENLIKSGVKIYEYKPGFIHSKIVVSDDEVGIVGSINMDYRSLYLHFECGTWLYKTSTVMDIKEDFMKTLELCIPITLEECQKVKWTTKLLRLILRLFAPMM